MTLCNYKRHGGETMNKIPLNDSELVRVRKAMRLPDEHGLCNVDLCRGGSVSVYVQGSPEDMELASRSAPRAAPGNAR